MNHRTTALVTGANKGIGLETASRPPRSASPRCAIQQGAEVIVRLATLADDGPTAGFFDEAGAIPW